MFTLEHEIRYSDYKDFEFVKTSAILEIIQEAAIRDSANCGYSVDDLRKIGKAWLLQGYNLHLEKPVLTKYPAISAFTAVKKMKGATSERGCIIYQNGEVVAKSIANWFIFDFEKMRPGRIPQEMSDAYEPHDYNDDFFTFQKPEMLEIETPEYTVKVSNKDIDTNRHLNNLKGAEILMDALPFDFEFTDMSVIYKHQAHLGDVLGVCVKELENGYYVHLETKNKDVCVAGTFIKN